MKNHAFRLLTITALVIVGFSITTTKAEAHSVTKKTRHHQASTQTYAPQPAYTVANYGYNPIVGYNYTYQGYSNNPLNYGYQYPAANENNYYPIPYPVQNYSYPVAQPAYYPQQNYSYPTTNYTDPTTDQYNYNDAGQQNYTDPSTTYNYNTGNTDTNTGTNNDQSSGGTTF